MCGICGQFNFKNRIPVHIDAVKRMASTMVHRGPDDEGYYFSGSVGLGFKRLSIIDLKTGAQPMSDQEQSVWVMLNGEIYNFPELRRELQGYGHVFRTKSDTEVIVHGYKHWGKAVLERLNGMFGLAIWDEKERQLLIARDRMGIKFLYYKLDTDQLIFASEIRALLAITDVKPEIEPLGLYQFLRYRFTPSPLTIFKDIKKLAPGSLLIVNERGSVYSERWWNFEPAPFDPVPTVEQAEEKLQDLYINAVKKHLISDVPVGLLLSGGVDSGLLLALMNQNGGSWSTYTVGYGKSFKDDEIADAAQTAKILGATNYSIELNREMFEAFLPKIIELLEEPIAPSSVVPMYFVCELARRHVKVALIGQGPDELFGGYKRHLGVQYGSYWRSLPGWFRGFCKNTLRHLPRSESIKRGLYSLDEPNRMKRYQDVLSLMPSNSIATLFKDGLLTHYKNDEILEAWRDLEPLMQKADELGGLQFLEVRSTLPDELLLYADKLSMAHSLELRVPYLDHEIVEYVERLPASFKVRYGTRKWLHKRVCNNFLPPDITSRRKRGFAVNVVDDWFRSTMNGKIQADLMEKSSIIYDYLSHQRITKLLRQHQSGREDNHKILFSLVVLEELLRNYITH